MPIRLAIFGAGRIGQVHARNAAAHPSVEVAYLVDPVASPGRDTLATEIGARVVDADAAFADDRIDGVVVASSTDTHADLVARAADAGKAVFCEKPISLDFAKTEALAERVRNAGIPCMLGFQRRYDASFRAVRDRIASGAAGRLEHLMMQSRDPAPPPASYVRTSGGMFRDTAIHDMDMARFLLDEEIASVYAVGSCLISKEIGAAGDIDTLMIVLKTRSGRLAQVTNCRRGPMGYDQRLEALCSEEVLWVENRPQTTMRTARPEGAWAAAPMNYFIERFAQAYRDEMNAFAEMVETGSRPLADLTDGLEAQRLVEAAIESHRTGLPIEFAPDWRPQ
ncbi:inositol 2-dehydrogenase [Aureimonas sp. ME7]|uniref:inositol 2-dehydrogenase n=1 Tax=Aureimonas sp. ME7 TaxID=2744252 RepID=UPI001AEE6E04|nr:inositol 2-dehydrogenase [Aureimonas sp. ME7]